MALTRVKDAAHIRALPPLAGQDFSHLLGMMAGADTQAWLDGFDPVSGVWHRAAAELARAAVARSDLRRRSRATMVPAAPAAKRPRRDAASAAAGAAAGSAAGPSGAIGDAGRLGV